MNTANNTAAIVAFSAGFTVTNRATGEVLIDASVEDALAIEAMMQADRCERGVVEVFDKLATISADVATQEYCVDIDAGNGQTALALYERVGQAIGMARKLGVLDAEGAAEAVYWSSEADGLPQINTVEMAEVSNPVIELHKMMEQIKAMGADVPSQNAPSVTTLQ